MKNILLLVHDDDGQEARLQAALDVTRAVDGHLTCLEVVALPLIVSNYYTGGGAEALLVEELREGESRMRAEIERRLAAEDVAWSLEQSHEPLAKALESHADLADLVVVSSRSRDGGHAGERRPETLPLKAGRAMLAVPPGAAGVDVTGPVVIAWDGSAPCNEALRAAVPLLKRSSRVTMLEVNNPDGAFAMHDAASYLSRHDISVSLVERETRGTIAHIIIDHAMAVDARYIVMGAYGMPSAAERIFGGVTRTMLAESALPLLLAH